MPANKNPQLNQRVVQELLEYNKTTGELHWKKRAQKWFVDERSSKIWNSRFSGQPAFTACTAYGYPCGQLLGALYLAHRIIWLWVTGEWPDEIDHINHDRADNRWNNLRSVPRAIQVQNYSMPETNTSGVMGVSKQKYKAGHGWVAYLNIRGKRVFCKMFRTFEEAVTARKDAEKRYGFHPNHGS